MIKKVYSLHDGAVGAYLQPFFMRSKGEALRAFKQLASDPQSNISQSPGDFTLFEIGEYDEHKGLMLQYDKKVCLGTALELFHEPA